MALQTHIDLSNQSLTDAGNTLNTNMDAVDAKLDRINYQFFPAGVNPVGNTEEVVATANLDANYLDVDSKGITIEVWIDFASNADNKTARVMFGASELSTTGVTIAQGFCKFECEVIRAGAGSQVCASDRLAADTGNLPGGAIGKFTSEDETAVIPIEVRLTCPTTNTDAKCYLLLVRPKL